MRRYVLAPEAALDLAEIWLYIRRESSEQTADRIERVIRDRFPVCRFFLRVPPIVDLQRQSDSGLLNRLEMLSIAGYKVPLKSNRDCRNQTVREFEDRTLPPCGRLDGRGGHIVGVDWRNLVVLTEPSQNSFQLTGSGL
jgi:hypothetical protein